MSIYSANYPNFRPLRKGDIVTVDESQIQTDSYTRSILQHFVLGEILTGVASPYRWVNVSCLISNNENNYTVGYAYHIRAFQLRKVKVRKLRERKPKVKPGDGTQA